MGMFLWVSELMNYFFLTESHFNSIKMSKKRGFNTHLKEQHKCIVVINSLTFNNNIHIKKSTKNT